MAAAPLYGALSTLALGERALSRVSGSGIHFIADVTRRSYANSSGSAVRHGKYFAALSGTGPFPSHNRTAVHISIGSNSWAVAARNLFWIFAVSHLQAGPGMGNYTKHQARRCRTRAGRSSCSSY